MAITTPSPVGDRARVRLLLEGSAENLLATWNEDLGLFPAISRLRGSNIVNQYDHPVAIRYTLGSLLGMAQAARGETLGVTDAQVHTMAHTFLTRAGERMMLPGDYGLLAMLHCALDAPAATLRDQAMRLSNALHADSSDLNMQDLSWLLWGAAALTRAGVGAALDVVRQVLALIEGLSTSSSGLPRHTNEWYRRHVVSFGALVYYLRAIHEAADTLDDERLEARFQHGVARAMAMQGPQGEWPWLINCRAGVPIDFYPVFAVHQDSMAMLFLHPAADRGVGRSEQAITRSLAWDFGDNQLGIEMFARRPFFPYRSIERAEHAPKLRRYLRALLGPISSRRAVPQARDVRLNDQCRSYHPGWILFVWANRREAQ